MWLKEVIIMAEKEIRTKINGLFDELSQVNKIRPRKNFFRLIFREQIFNEIDEAKSEAGITQRGRIAEDSSDENQEGEQ